MFRVLEVLASVATVLGLYFGVYTILLARHKLRLNRASYERSAFIDLVTSGNRGAFVAAMQNFGPVQMMKVLPEPALWPPFLNWWGESNWPNWPNRLAESNRPNMELLYMWAYNFFPLCTPQLCGEPDSKEPNNPDKGVRINLRGAYLWEAYLRGMDLRRADFYGANLSQADLRGADLRGAYWNHETIWPEGFTPPCPVSTRKERCEPEKEDKAPAAAASP